MTAILIPDQQPVCRLAAETFRDLWSQVTGENLEITLTPPEDGALIVLGSDAVNAFTHAKIVAKVIPQFNLRTGTDDYQIASATDSDGRELLFLAGGRPRALLYAVYHFFELRADCRYFWDGDIIPRQDSIDLTGLQVTESPRFEYRGLRYFAHRSLTRFQAEHWDLQEWKREIDWMLKKRFNLFMLRIGLDDLFQKAFPDIVSYPEDGIVPESTPRSYDDRNLFWPLQYRGQLRRELLAYARERDLLHPEDLGTMTHWYSRTPHQYLEKIKPDFMPQATSGYGDPTGLVWDIRQDKFLEDYFHLTETHIREYGAPDLFHTIGLAERRCYDDREANHQMKLYTYRRIISRLRQKYPHAPLLIGSWDFCMYWTPEEVRSLVAELDPANTLIFDYTSDTDDELRTFQNWDLVGNFPWIYGIFHAFEDENDIRGNYDAIARRLPIAARDPMCKGMVMWPECSHTDTLMLEFLAANAWNPSPENVHIETFIKTFCRQRYQGPQTAAMTSIWTDMLPLIKVRHWNAPRLLPFQRLHHDFYAKPFSYLTQLSAINLQRAAFYRERLADLIPAAPALLRRLADIRLEQESPMLFRDVIDLARTAAGRILLFAYTRLIGDLDAWHHGHDNQEEVRFATTTIHQLMNCFGNILAASPEFSLHASLLDLQAKHECYPDFEKTLKGNAENFYCRTAITELVFNVYLPEYQLVEEWIEERLNENNRSLWINPPDRLKTARQAVIDRFYDTPLAEMAPDTPAARAKLADTLRQTARLGETILA